MKIINLFEAAVNTGQKRIWFMKTDGEMPQRSICTRIFVVVVFCVTAWKVSVFGAFLVLIFPHSDWIRRDSSHLSIFSWITGKIRIRKIPNTETFQAVCVSTFASVCYSILVYTVTTLNVIQRKNSKYCVACEVLLTDRVFGNIFRQYFG